MRKTLLNLATQQFEVNIGNYNQQRYSAGIRCTCETNYFLVLQGGCLASERIIIITKFNKLFIF
jgi:hypothetical protein